MSIGQLLVNARAICHLTPSTHNVVVEPLGANFQISEHTTRICTPNTVFGLDDNAPPALFAWSRTQKNTPRPAAGDSLKFNENDGKPADEVVLKNLLSLPRGYQSSRLGLHPLLTLILRTTADRNETKTTHKSTAAQTKNSKLLKRRTI